MATVPATIEAASPRGIATTLTDLVIENETITKADQADPVPDQNGAVADEITYDTRTDLRLTVRSAKATVGANTIPTTGSTLAYNSVNYHVDSVEEAGTYNGLRRWNITAHRYTNWPAATSSQSGS